MTKRVLLTSDPLLPPIIENNHDRISELPSDIIYVLLKSLKLHDVVSCQLVCKQWERIFNGKFIWLHLLKNHFPLFCIPNGANNFQLYKDQYHHNKDQYYHNFTHGLYTLEIFNDESPLQLGPKHLHSVATFNGQLFCSSFNKIYVHNLDNKTWIDTLTLAVPCFIAKHLAISDRKLIYSCVKAIYSQNLDQKTSTCIFKLDSIVQSLAASNGKLFFSGTDGMIHVWDLTTNTCIAKMKGSEKTVIALAASHEKLFSVSENDNGKIRVWDLNTLACIAILNEHETDSTALAISNGHLLAGAEGGLIKFWKLENISTDTDCLCNSIGVNRGPIKFLAASHGQLVSLGSRDNGQMRITNFNTEHIKVLEQLAEELGHLMERQVVSDNDDEEDNLFDRDEEMCLRLKRMPEATKDEIFGELAEILKRENPDGVEDISEGDLENTVGTHPLDKHLEAVTSSQVAQAIRNYLQKQPKTQMNKV